MSTLSQFGGGSIKSIQRGTISIGSGVTTATATITAVNTAKTELRLLGATTNNAAAGVEYLTSIALTNSTTVTATRGTSGITTSVSWELTEFN